MNFNAGQEQVPFPRKVEYKLPLPLLLFFPPEQD